MNAEGGIYIFIEFIFFHEKVKPPHRSLTVPETIFCVSAHAQADLNSSHCSLIWNQILFAFVDAEFSTKLEVIKKL